MNIVLQAMFAIHDDRFCLFFAGGISMRWIKACMIAFSMYSRIPMPRFEWKESDMKYALCFFPAVGGVIGICLFLWQRICLAFRIGQAAYILVGTAIPLLITGGFHADGFMDTEDALCSLQSRERKLEILKDSHIGTGSVIRFFIYYLIYLAAFSEVRGERAVLIIGIGFVLSRVLSGIGMLTFRHARKDGMLRRFSDSTEKKTVLPVLLLELVMCMAGMLALSPCIGIFSLTGAAVCFMYYRYRSEKEFGGITGDTAGYFLLLCEAVVMAGAALGGRF